MKIALLDADPRICGPMSWLRHLASGFLELGHEVSIVSSTQSGRPRSGWGVPKWGGRWSAFSPDVTLKHSELTAALNAYDFIVLPEPKVPAVDKEAVKAEAVPQYVTSLIETTTPWTSALHGNNYAEKDAPFFNALLGSASFVGSMISHSQRSTDSLDQSVKDTVHFDLSTLPYRPVNDVDADAPPLTRTVGTTGRFMFNKGSHIVSEAAQFMPSDTVIELWGSATTGLGTNVTFAVYEGLLPQAEKYVRHADQIEKAGQPGVTEHGNTIRPYLWDVRLKTGQLVRYLGNYTDAIKTAARLQVHVNLTGYKYSGGLVEYSTLEAMDAGSLCITPRHVSDDRFRTKVVDLLNPPGSMKSLQKSPEILTDVAGHVNQLLEASENSAWRNEVIRHNREQIRVVSDPVKVADLFLSYAR